MSHPGTVRTRQRPRRLSFLHAALQEASSERRKQRKGLVAAIGVLSQSVV